MITLKPREFHLFQAAGRDFLYLVPSAAIFALDEASSAVLGVVTEQKRPEEAVIAALAGRFDPATIRDAIADMLEARAIGYEHEPEVHFPRVLPLMPVVDSASASRTGVIPLTTMVMNVTNQCNLACTYCYEYGEDKIVDTEHGQKPKFMAEQTARDSVEFLLRESGSVAHLTFFGGETLLNFPVLQSTVAYGRRRAAELGNEFLEHAAENKHHGFSNVKDTLEEIHKGVSKAYPCGAGLGLLGVSTDGDVAVCHRFAGSDTHKLGTVRDGIDREAQSEFLQHHHIADKTDCHTCWARPLCAGGCYHEAHVRYGTTRRPNLHYCEWIRGWTDTCLQIYGELAVRNPDFLARFDRDEAKAEAAL